MNIAFYVLNIVSKINIKLIMFLSFNNSSCLHSFLTILYNNVKERNGFYHELESGLLNHDNSNLNMTSQVSFSKNHQLYVCLFFFYNCLSHTIKIYSYSLIYSRPSLALYLCTEWPTKCHFVGSGS